MDYSRRGLLQLTWQNTVLSTFVFWISSCRDALIIRRVDWTWIIYIYLDNLYLSKDCLLSRFTLHKVKKQTVHLNKLCLSKDCLLSRFTLHKVKKQTVYYNNYYCELKMFILWPFNGNSRRICLDLFLGHAETSLSSNTTIKCKFDITKFGPRQ